MKKTVLYVFGAALLLLVIAIVGWWVYYQSLYKAYQSPSVSTHHVAGDSLNTNSIATFSEQEIAMYGKWKEDNEDVTFMVFSLDDAEDGFYWGKEWCESDGVFETDLKEHGNGWFRWKIKKNKLLLLHSSNFGFVMPNEYTIMQLEDTTLGMQSQFSRSNKLYNRTYN